MAMQEQGEHGPRYRWLTEADVPGSIGQLSGFMGNTAIIKRTYA